MTSKICNPQKQKFIYRWCPLDDIFYTQASSFFGWHDKIFEYNLRDWEICLTGSGIHSICDYRFGVCPEELKAVTQKSFKEKRLAGLWLPWFKKSKSLFGFGNKIMHILINLIPQNEFVEWYITTVIKNGNAYRAVVNHYNETVSNKRCNCILVAKMLARRLTVNYFLHGY